MGLYTYIYVESVDGLTKNTITKFAWQVNDRGEKISVRRRRSLEIVGPEHNDWKKNSRAAPDHRRENLHTRLRTYCDVRRARRTRRRSLIFFKDNQIINNIDNTSSFQNESFETLVR